MSGTSITMAEVIRKAIESRVATIRVSMPGKILTFDPATQVAEVQPLINELFIAERGERVSQELPVLPHVPVVFPSGGGFSLTFPVQAGDECLLVFSDRSLDSWWTNGDDNKDERRHDLSDAVCFVGVRRDGKAIPNFNSSCVSIGQDGAQEDFVALAQKVLTELQNITNAFNSHVHMVSTAGTAAAQTGSTTSVSPTMPSPQSVASGTVKIKG